jgi:hypothetical protein
VPDIRGNVSEPYYDYDEFLEFVKPQKEGLDALQISKSQFQDKAP